MAASTATADLYPGFNDGDLYFTIDNPNPYPVTFTSATPGTLSLISPTGCPAATNISFDAAPWTISISFPANTTVGIGATIADVVHLSSTALDACQGKNFTIPVTLSGSQS